MYTTAYEMVEEFNDIAGNLRDIAESSILLQINIIKEEFDEVWDAFVEKSPESLLKEVCDLFVTVAGLMQKLEYSGYDVSQALGLVCQNNLDKFPTDLPTEPDDSYCYSYNSDSDRYVIKNADGKIMKPEGYSPVELFGLYPKSGWFEHSEADHG